LVWVWVWFGDGTDDVITGSVVVVGIPGTQTHSSVAIRIPRVGADADAVLRWSVCGSNGHGRWQQTMPISVSIPATTNTSIVVVNAVVAAVVVGAFQGRDIMGATTASVTIRKSPLRPRRRRL